MRTAKLLMNLGEIVNEQGDYVRAEALYEESLKIQREMENKEGIARVLYRWAWALIVSRGSPEKARTLLEECLVLGRDLVSRDIIASCLIYLGHSALGQDNLLQARALLEEGLVHTREIGNLWTLVENLCALAKVAFVQGDYTTARLYAEESLETARKIGSRLLIASSLERFAETVAGQGEPVRAAQLWGAAEMLREEMGAPITPLERLLHEQIVAEARTQSGEQAFAAAWSQGRNMTLEQALAPADAVMLPPQETQQKPLPLVRPSPSYPSELTGREVEVLRLVAQGLTNAQIAEQLIISSHTVNSHVRSILSKLGLTSRSAIIHFAYEHHLA